MKAKGLVVKNFPEHWTNWINPEKENKMFTKEEIEFNNKLLIDKRPMFMKYLYPAYKAKYKKHYNKYNYLCYRTFGIYLEELFEIQNKTEEQQRLVDNYNKFNPLLDSDCIMNNICKHMEESIKEIKLNVSQSVPEYIFDILYNKDIEITEEQINKMIKVYKSYRKSQSKSNNIEIVSVDENGDIVLVRENDAKFLDFDYISDDIQRLANLAVYVNYYLYPKSNKNFCWDIFGEGIILNIYDNSNKEFYIPLQNSDGDIKYMGKRYKNERVNIECQ